MNFKFEEIEYKERSGEVPMSYANKRRRKKIPFTIPKYSHNSTALGNFITFSVHL